MRFNSLVFNDLELDVLLGDRKNKLGAKKSLILFFLTLPDFKNLFEVVYLPESILNDEEFFKQVRPLMGKIGVSFDSKLIIGEEGILDYSYNPLQDLVRYKAKYDLYGVHYKVNFGKRLIQKSPKYDEYVLNSQYNWMNVVIMQQYCLKNSISLMVDLMLSFMENSSEDYYIHMRQILWEGVDIFRRMNMKFSMIRLVVSPFYPRLRGLRNGEILDSANIAHTTLRCVTECLSKEKMLVLVRSCVDFSLVSYVKYLRYYGSHGKDVEVEGILCGDCLVEYVRDWDFREKNLREAQTNFLGVIGKLSSA